MFGGFEERAQPAPRNPIVLHRRRQRIESHPNANGSSAFLTRDSLDGRELVASAETLRDRAPEVGSSMRLFRLARGESFQPSKKLRTH